MTPATEGAAKGAPQDLRAQVRQPRTPLIDAVMASLEGSKAEETVSIPLRGKSSIADFMVVASGRSNRHVASIADRLMADLKAAGYGRLSAEGMENADWVLIDAGDVIVHVFRPEVRAFYNLEKMWSVGEAQERMAV